MVWVVGIFGIFVDFAAEKPRNASGEAPREEGGWVREALELPVREDAKNQDPPEEREQTGIPRPNVLRKNDSRV